jgi:uncharacterized protein YfbU (UPF0304 family)
MPTISIRVSDELKERLETMASDSNTSMSAAITEVLRSATGMGREDYPEDMSPVTLSSTNRMILLNQEKLLASAEGIDAEKREGHLHNAEILASGYTGMYSEVFAELRPEVSNRLCDEVYDILDMFRVLHFSYERLNDEERAQVDERTISYQGFDLQRDEGRLAGFVDFVVDGETYSELLPQIEEYTDGGNSHGPRLEVYERMLRCFKQVYRKHLMSASLLSLGEIQQVADAARHDSGY